jgi:thiol peroxidase
MAEREGAITFKGNPLTLIGQDVDVGDQAPDFTAIATDLSDRSLSEWSGKVIVLSAVPSLDTGVCSTQTKKFNEEAGKLGDDVAVLTISMDLPFAQARWCGQEDADNVVTLSDHRDADFATKYGLLIRELRLIARAVLVVDTGGRVVYKELVEEMTNEPNYEAALAAVKQATGEG